MQLQYICQGIRDRIVELAHRIHRHPELSHQELRTTALLTDALKNLDMELPEMQPATGVIGLLRGKLSGPTIAMRADIDALPIQETAEHQIRSETANIMHACGHDFHTAALLGAAMALAARRDTLPGNVLFIFQPAEEQCSGAEAVIATGIFDRYPPAAFFSLHVKPDIPAGIVGIREGPIMAAQGCFSIRVCGKGGHGATPHLAKDPVITAARIIDALQTIRSRWADPAQPFALSVCSIHGGSACNIIPDDVRLEGTYRFALDAYKDTVKEQIVHIANSIAQAHGCTAICDFFREAPPLVNDKQLAKLAYEAAAGQYGPENLIAQDFWMASEDFSFYRNIAPTFMYHVGVGADDGSSAGLHNPCFLVPDDTAAACAELLTRTALIALQEGTNATAD